jgi:hypothetical protein
MNSKVKIDTSVLDELLLEVLLQALGNQEGTEIDNQCLSAFEDACDYLTERGYLYTLNGRIYKIKEIKKYQSHEGTKK